MILTDIKDNSYDLSVSKNFIDHYNSTHSCAEIILSQLNGKSLYSFLQGYDDLTVVDLGANVGLFSLFVSPIAKQVHAVEPTPDHCNILKELVLNAEVDNIELHQLGIHTEDGSVEFNIHTRNSTMNSFVTCNVDPHSGRTVSVRTKTLSTLIDDIGCDQVDFVKMDIEGFETAVILHPSFQKVKGRVRSFFIEVHDFEGRDGIDTNVSNISKVFADWNMRVVRMSHDAILVH